MHHRMSLLGSCLALVLTGAIASAQPAGDTTESVLGRWRVTRARVAPWVYRAKLTSGNRSWIGRTITFAPGRVTGPGVLNCGRARYTATRVPAPLLFQGALTAPTADAADLGIVALPAPGARLRCDTGVFELHRADASTLLIALDNVIYTLDRSPGALAPDTAPAGVVERLLEHHFAGPMRFDAATLKGYAPWLTTKLRERIAAYFAKPNDGSEVPTVNGDPFTDSQEPPTRFSVALGIVRGEAAAVPVRITFQRRSRVVTYVLRRDGGAWRVDDLRFERRGTLTRLLR